MSLNIFVVVDLFKYKNKKCIKKYKYYFINFGGLNYSMKEVVYM